MSLVPLMLLAQTTKVKEFVRQNQRPLFNAAMGVLTFSLSFQVMRKEVWGPAPPAGCGCAGAGTAALTHARGRAVHKSGAPRKV